MLQADYTTQFMKDLKLAKKRNLPLQEIKNVMDMLIQEIPLPQQFKDHNLSGNKKGRRECHVQPDWLLIYRKSETVISFERTGTHSDLF
ncbi:MAG: type II toxin-antitoxin system YafQ family toxin [Sphaerochaetaceae bacterium]|jgi:mRNA interferase YafQ